ncbi:carboxymuconolactone decarboxylase family protein [Haloechinothrix halophila]|uniref:carboxymuconolactone decarboxylase family protein n=1 Tax=Haloechinothrix halophila TaxID=1069073 RepID=UPI000423FD9E|nr:carboxymuconolactone decarboxylase family protein [Haloechinothrix halophila]
MAHVDPIKPEENPELAPAFAAAEAALGFVPNSLLTMARKPDILRGVAALTASTLREGLVSRELKSMIAEVTSTAAESRYCQAHGAVGMSRAGIDPAKAAALWEYETSPHFDDAERAVLDLARNAAVLPNAVTVEHFAALRSHFSDEEIVEIVAVVATFGFFNRWNDTMASDLEEIPLTTATEYLAGTDWEPGKHASGTGAADPPPP